MVKNEYYGNEDLDLVRDRIKVLRNHIRVQDY